MALVTFKDLCIDAVNPISVGEFWAAALGLRAERLADGGMVLRGANQAQTVWINQVPEAKSMKNRVHIDVNASSVAEVETMGATLLPEWGPFDWTVLADPEGGELCVFERDRSPAARHDEVAPRWDDAYRLYELCVDAVDPTTIAQWWADVFGATSVGSEREFSWIEGVEGCPFDSFVFPDVAESKTVKNRIHWDVSLVRGATVEDLIAKGATLIRGRGADLDWSVMADPEGNEFCVFAAD